MPLLVIQPIDLRHLALHHCNSVRLKQSRLFNAQPTFASAMLAGAAVYRLLTSAFVHGGLLHVAFNMMAFVPIGTSLERMQGTLALIHLISLLLLLGGGSYVALATAASYIPWRYALAIWLHPLEVCPPPWFDYYPKTCAGTETLSVE